MAQYDLLLTQNIHVSGIEFTERYINLAKGSLLSSNGSSVPTVLPVGTNGYILVADSAETTGLKWVVQSAGHTQNTDTGTTATSFQIDSSASGPRIKNETGVLAIRNAADNAYADGKMANLVVTGNLTVQGTETILETATLQVEDKNIELGKVTTPTDTTADGGGITLLGTTNKTILWDNANDNWTLNQNVNIPTGFTYKINNVTVLSATQVLGVTLGTMASATATDYVAKALFDANTILKADTDNTPAALTVGASTIVGRESSGSIAALTPAQAMNVLWVTAPATKTSTGTAGQIAKDDNFFYICTATNVWKRSAIATNW